MQRYIETNRSRVHVSITVDRFLLRCTLDTPYFGESKGSFKCITLFKDRHILRYRNKIISNYSNSSRAIDLKYKMG